MIFKFEVGPKIFLGNNCIAKNADEFPRFGQKAFIVTGKNSGKLSGCLEDVIQILEYASIDYFIYDKVENNPSFSGVVEGGKATRSFGADFVIGIGGGSSLDSAKAIAVLSQNNIEPELLYTREYNEKPLSVIAIPTTAGSGSEVTQYANLTRTDLGTKMSFGNGDTYPVQAYLDARYTMSMPYDVTTSSAMDALSHAVEGYLNSRSTPMSDIYALEAISIFGESIERLLNNDIDHVIREKLLFSSLLAGITIANTGTGFLHRMGYSLTYFKNIQHGKANGLLLKEYLRFQCDTMGEKVHRILGSLQMKHLDEIQVLINNLFPERDVFDENEIHTYAEITNLHKKSFYSTKAVNKDDLFIILKRSLM